MLLKSCKKVVARGWGSFLVKTLLTRARGKKIRSSCWSRAEMQFPSQLPGFLLVKKRGEKKQPVYLLVTNGGK